MHVDIQTDRQSEGEIAYTLLDKLYHIEAHCTAILQTCLIQRRNWSECDIANGFKTTL